MYICKQTAQDLHQVETKSDIAVNPEVKLDEAVNGHRQIVRDFAKENNFPLLDLYKLMYGDRYKLLLPDGIHFNPAGHAFLAEKLYEALKEYLSL